MKTLELNEMENVNGGKISAECSMQIGLYAVANGMVLGPWGFAIGAAAGYFFGDQC